MFDLRTLESVKIQNKVILEHPDALPENSLLLEGRYCIISVEEMCERTFIYKAFDIIKNKFVSIKEFFPKEAFGSHEELYFIRNLETLRLELKAPNEYKIKQYKSLIAGFIEEAKYLEKISYGNPILKILDAFEDLNSAYIVSNYNQWPSLQDFLETHYIFNTDELSWITTELVDAVERFHKRNIVHRNIQPKNIYFKPGELILDSMGTCDFLQDIKIYDASKNESKYFAPEIMMHNGIIGTWTDVYAIGKILIDVISRMTDSDDYFDGLELLPVSKRNIYAKLIKKSVVFNYEKRYSNALVVKSELIECRNKENTFKSPRGMIAVIAMISFISCALFVLQLQNDTIMADNYYIIEENELPLGGGFFDKKECYFTTEKDSVFDLDKQELAWFASNRVLMSHLEITQNDVVIEVIELDKREMNLTLDLKSGLYNIKLYYKLDTEILLEIIGIEIRE